MGKLAGWKGLCAVSLFCAAAAIASPGQIYNVLVNFDGANGAGPDAPMTLVQGLDGKLYGTTDQGGVDYYGTVFKVTTDGTLTPLHSFCSEPGCADGSGPYAGLVQSNIYLYGTTKSGGSNNAGTIFKITPAGKLTTLYSFCAQDGCPDGSNPYAGLVQGASGLFYGTTFVGGAYGAGTIFRISSSGELTTLYSFCAQTGCTDGSNPYASLVQGADGNFYGTTYTSGAYDAGTVFKITPGGALTRLYSFCGQTNCTDGATPYSGLVQGTDRYFYGTTIGGGATGYGEVFKITSQGALTTLYSFCAQTNCADGAAPYSGLVQATDGFFYGTTEAEGANLTGTIFKISSGGTLTTLFTFCNGTYCYDGGPSLGGLLQATDGNFYGVTWMGGTSDDGTLFRLSEFLSPFVETRPVSNEVGKLVFILGTNLTGSSGVSFGGAAATFKVVSSSEITTTVPSGATTGSITVTTPGGALTSEQTFRVIPVVTSITPTKGPVGTPIVITGVSFTQATNVAFVGSQPVLR